MALCNIAALGSVADSSSASVTIDVDGYTQDIYVAVGVKYAAVAGTTGITAKIQVSPDGTNFTDSAGPNLVLEPPATVLGTGELVFRTRNDPYRADGGPVSAIKVVLTNADDTNAATYVVSYTTRNGQA
mgnify:CR=1 FL=1